MCGIAGYYGKKELSPQMIDKCLQLMQHRGPDHLASYQHHHPSGNFTFLLHRRLSIIDLDSRAHQPFRSGNNVIAVNGELYNYLELKQQLQKSGVAFRTTSDTEVMIKALEKEGWQRALDSFEGMWAFALYNEDDGSLLLSRDRFGEKPLYLYRDVSGIYFGSEIKFIAALLGHRLTVNYNHLYRYLVNGFKALYKTEEQFFHGVSELPAARTLVLNQRGNELQAAYWQPSCRQNEDMNLEDAVAGLKNKLLRSVELRLRADVPLAFCMSGGVDSNSLISIAKRVFDYNVHGFTLVSSDERYTEQEMVSHAVEELGIRHTAVPISNTNFLENLFKIILHHDAPIYTISYYIHWQLMAAISQYGYRISFSGTAADELLTGYYDHHNLYLYEILNKPNYIKALEGWQKRVAPLVRNPYLQDPRLYINNPQARAHVYLNNDQFADYLKHCWFEEFSEVSYCESLLRNCMLNELFREIIPVILHEDDLNAMYYSIENRSPFLDRRLFEFCISIPSRHLVRDGYAKVLLRDAMKDIVPERILWNPRKVGFNAPVFSLLDIKNKEIKAWILDDGPVYEHIKKPMIENLISKQELPNSESKFLFNFVCMKAFLEIFS